MTNELTISQAVVSIALVKVDKKTMTAAVFNQIPQADFSPELKLLGWVVAPDPFYKHRKHRMWLATIRSVLVKVPDYQFTWGEPWTLEQHREEELRTRSTPRPEAEVLAEIERARAHWRASLALLTTENNRQLYYSL